MIRAHWKYFVSGLLLATALCGRLLAHQDVLIRLEGKTLVGLPHQYSPAELDLEAFRLRVGQHVMEFSPLLQSFFRRQPYDLRVSASWYHGNEDGGLPPYLALHITPKRRDYAYRLLFALDTLRLIDISVDLHGSQGPPETYTMQHLRIALSDFERKQIEESIKDVP
jgi:hypothetical protein